MGDLSSDRINVFGILQISKFCVNSHLVTFRVHTRLLAKFDLLTRAPYKGRLKNVTSRIVMLQFINIFFQPNLYFNCSLIVHLLHHFSLFSIDISMQRVCKTVLSVSILFNIND